MQLPRMVTVYQTFDAPKIDNICAVVRQEMNALQLSDRVRGGDTVAVTAGSRGVANIATITGEIVAFLRELGTVPFIVPAMGSHGGGTAEGQLEVLAGYGITEDSMGVPIRSTRETVVVAETPQGIPVRFDRHAAEANHVLVVNRIKPHTGFVGPIESGLHKMMLIGLGNHEGALTYHRAILRHSFSEILNAVAKSVLEKCGVIGGIAIVENARDETALIESIAPDRFAERETELLRTAVGWLPSLPLKECDLLIIDRIGKNISGSGMDTNVVGRKFNFHRATESDAVSCLRILVRALTEQTHGNACGIGLSEYTTQRCVDQIDPVSTRVNCMTAQHPEVGMVPITLPTDRDALEAALQTIGLTEPQDARIIQIADTLHLSTVRVSEPCLPELVTSKHLKVDGDVVPFPFDEDGRLADVNCG